MISTMAIYMVRILLPAIIFLNYCRLSGEQCSYDENIITNDDVCAQHLSGTNLLAHLLQSV